MPGTPLLCKMVNTTEMPAAAEIEGVVATAITPDGQGESAEVPPAVRRQALALPLAENQHSQIKNIRVRGSLSRVDGVDDRQREASIEAR